MYQVLKWIEKKYKIEMVKLSLNLIEVKPEKLTLFFLQQDPQRPEYLEKNQLPTVNRQLEGQI